MWLTVFCRHCICDRRNQWTTLLNNACEASDLIPYGSSTDFFFHLCFRLLLYSCRHRIRCRAYVNKTQSASVRSILRRTESGQRQLNNKKHVTQAVPHLLVGCSEAKRSKKMDNCSSSPGDGDPGNILYLNTLFLRMSIRC